MSRFRGDGAALPWAAAGLVVLALLACKKKDEQALPDVAVPDAGTAPVAADTAAPPPATETAAAADAAPAPTPTQPVTRPVQDAGTVRTDAGTAQDAGAAPHDAGATAPVDAGRPPDLVACGRACQTQLTACLSRIVDGGSNTTCTNEWNRCQGACRQH